jgi:hypothetical protein
VQSVSYVVPFSLLAEKLGFSSSRSESAHVRWEALLEASKLIALSVPVDEDWYLQEYKDVAAAVVRGIYRSARHHFVECGYVEGRHPSAPVVDEKWYLSAYPDVAEGTETGEIVSAQDHYEKHGYKEGRLPCAF